MTDDVIHSTQYYMKDINRAILTNLLCRPLKLGRLMVLQETYGYKNLCSHGNSLFSSPHQLDFNMLVIFSLTNVKQGHKLKLTYLYACCIMHMKCCQQIPKWNVKGGQKSFYMGEDWNPVCCHGNRTVKLVMWRTFSRILLQRIKHF